MPTIDVAIGIGAWLGTIMLLDARGLVWPNQLKRQLAGKRRQRPDGG